MTQALIAPILNEVNQFRKELASFVTLSTASFNELIERTQRRTIRFTTSGTFTPPSHIQWVHLVLIGGGGGGGARLVSSSGVTLYQGLTGGMSSFGNINAVGGGPGGLSSDGSAGIGGGKAQAYSLAANERVLMDRGAGPAALAQRTPGLDGSAMQRATGVDGHATGGGSFQYGGFWNGATYVAPAANGGGGGGASVDTAAGNLTATALGGGGGEIITCVVPVAGPVGVIVGKGGAGNASYGLAGADGICIVMY